MRKRIRRHELGVTISVLLLAIFGVYLLPDMVVFVHSGEQAVLWRRFAGTEIETTYGEGTHIIWPWDEMTVYSVRHQIVHQVYEALSKDGLAIEIEVSTRFRPNREALGLLHRELGPRYQEVIVVPEVGVATRSVIARYRPEDLYTADRVTLQEEIVELARSEGLERHVEIDDVLVRNIVLPAEVRRAIETKLAEEQNAQRYEFVLARERQEAERKRIEAQGIHDFQNIVSAGISEQYLKWKGIDATLSLAQSSNSKVVVIGAGENGMPLILGGEPTTTAPPAPAPPGGGGGGP